MQSHVALNVEEFLAAWENQPHRSFQGSGNNYIIHYKQVVRKIERV